jgi:hypothetical protein
MVCPNKLSFLFKIKLDAICTSNCPFGPTQYVPNDSCLDPVSVIPILSAHCLLPLVLSSLKAAAVCWHWHCFVFTQFYVTPWTFLQ